MFTFLLLHYTTFFFLLFFLIAPFSIFDIYSCLLTYLILFYLFYPFCSITSGHIYGEYQSSGMILSGQASRPISIGQLHAFQRFHLRPINLLVWKGPLGTYGRDT